jgi:hypothetical protein
MKRLLLPLLMVIFSVAITSAQSNRIVFGPLVGDDAGDIWAVAGDDIDIEMFVRTDPNNEVPIVGVNHSLMSEDEAIAERYEYGVTFDPDYGQPNWEVTFVDGPFFHDPSDAFPIPEGHTSQSAVALWIVFNDPVGDPLDTGGEWDLFGHYTMGTNAHADGEYYPLSSGWYPHSGQGTGWAFENPPGGSVIPDQDFCGIWFGGMATEEEDNLPAEFSLDQNYPNPFNATTTIKFSLPEESNVTIEIYDILGRKIETLVSGIQPAGSHSIVWDAENQPSGVYFYQLEAGAYVETRSCLLLK